MSTLESPPPPGQHLAAILPAPHAPLELVYRTTPTPSAGEILIDVRAIALNPLDWKMQTYGFAVKGYPAVIGTDIAGVVLACGPDMPPGTPAVGTRVCAFAPSVFTEAAPDYGGFQTKVLVPATYAMVLPDSLKFSEATLLPASVLTAWTAYHVLGLPFTTSYKPDDYMGMLVWGGASSIGSAGIQVAKQMGFTVYTTASPKHTEYLKSLGASRVFDYKSSTVVDSIVTSAISDGISLHLAFDAAGDMQACMDVLKEFGAEDGETAMLAEAVPFGDDAPKTPGVEMLFVRCYEEAARSQLYRQAFMWLRKQLDAGTYVPSPKLEIVEGGLAAAQKGMDILKSGVSGVKLVLEV
ncbi:chaperonin 10-like protein [Limtongia smithiae]|uniref:chaperonin 10-like protein n=1 Tax=Limtongia smithiae TaxID=1125753 RepID=UPI0034CDE187